MADKKISDYTEAASVDDNDWLETENAAGNSRKVKGSTVRAAGTVHLIGETVTTGSSASVNFTSIPATFRDLELRVRGRGDTAATLISLRARFNGDSGSNYDWQALQGNGAGAAAYAGLADSSIYLGIITADSATAGIAASVRAMIGDYRGTTFQKSGISHSGYKDGTVATSDLFTDVAGFHWRSTVAINAVLVFPETGNFKDGTVVSLYGHY